METIRMPAESALKTKKSFMLKSPIMKNYLKGFAPFFIVIVIGLIGIVGYLIAKNIKVPPTPSNQTTTPTQSPIQLPDADTTNWKAYTNTEYGFSFSYPPAVTLYTGNNLNKVENLTYIPVCDLDRSASCLYYSNKEFPNTNFSGAGLSINILKVNSDSCNTLERPTGSVAINEVKFIKGAAGGAAAGNQNEDLIYRTFHNGTCFEIRQRITTNSSDVNTVNGGVKSFTENDKNKITKLFDQILSTFKFLELKVTPIATNKPQTKKLVYFLPSGWQKVNYEQNTFQIGYDPNTMKTEQGVNGITIYKLRPDPKYGYMSYAFVGLYSYGGGSRHQFIYDKVGQTPQKQNYLPHYKEYEYTYNGKSCLFLAGIGISQINKTWGMCDAGNGKAFLITSIDDTNFQEIVQTIKLL